MLASQLLGSGQILLLCLFGQGQATRVRGKNARIRVQQGRRSKTKVCVRWQGLLTQQQKTCQTHHSPSEFCYSADSFICHISPLRKTWLFLPDFINFSYRFFWLLPKIASQMFLYRGSCSCAITCLPLFFSYFIYSLSLRLG